MRAGVLEGGLDFLDVTHMTILFDTVLYTMFVGQLTRKVGHDRAVWDRRQWLC